VRHSYILVDVDSKQYTPEQLRARFHRVMKMLWPMAGRFAKSDVYESPGGKGYHLVGQIWTTHRIREEWVVFAQLLCYSDPNREIANLSRIKSGVVSWNRLFSTVRERLVEDACKQNRNTGIGGNQNEVGS
jgi:hypothetical protein